MLDLEAHKIRVERQRERVAARYRANKPAILARKTLFRNNNRERLRALDRARYHTKPQLAMLKSSKSRAKRYGIQFNLDESDIVIPNQCPILGIKLSLGNTNAEPNSPSLDRIRPHLGYVKGNVWVISYRANRIKCDASLEELKMLVAALEHRMKETE